MAVSAALLNRLNKEEEPFETKLKLATAVFESTEFPSHRKEEIVLQWLCELEEKRNENVWLSLKYCLTSSRWKNSSSIWIKPSVTSLICQVLCDNIACNVLQESLSLLVKECAIHTLENPYMQHHFRYNLEDFFNLVSVTLNAYINNEDIIVRVVKCIQTIHNQVFQKEHFSYLFITKGLKAVGLASENNGSAVQVEVVKCVQQVIFPKSQYKEMSEILQLLFDSNYCENVKNQNAQQLFELLAESEEMDNNLCVLVFRSFVTTYSKDTVATLRFFILLCFFLGFRPRMALNEDLSCMLKHKDFKRIFPNHQIKKINKKETKSFTIMTKMVQTLSTINVQLEVEECKFLNWLQALILSSMDTLLPEVLQLLSAVIDLNPLILEPCMEGLLEKIVFVKKNYDMHPAYTAFMCKMLKNFSKLGRLQKLISKLLTHTGQREFPLLSDVLPPEFCTEFCNLVALLPSWQAMATMKTFLFHLSSDCIQILEKESQPGETLPLLSLQMASALLSNFLRGTRMADHSTPQQVLIKFSDVMSELAELLGRLGQALLHREHNCRLMKAFLQLCYYWGELQILLLHYSKLDITNKLKLSALHNDASATNLTCVHSYLASELWNLVAQRVSNFGEAECKEIMIKLVLQKLRAVGLFMEEEKKRQETMTIIARYIVLHIRNAWPLMLVEDNATIITPLLSSEELDLLATYLVQELTDNTNDKTALFHNLTRPGIQQNRLFVLSLVCASLCEIQKLFCKSKRKRDSESLVTASPCLARKVLSKINPTLVLQSVAEEKYEVLSLVMDMSALINTDLEKSQEFASASKMDALIFKRHLHLLHLLPIQYLAAMLKNMVLMSVLAIAISLKNWQVDREIAKKLHGSLLLGIMDSQNPPDIARFLDAGLVTRWLLNNELELTETQHQLLLQRVFESSLRAGALSNLPLGVPLLKKTEAKVLQSKKSICAASVLLQVLYKHSKKSLNEKDCELYVTFKHTISKGIIRAMKNEETAAIALSGFKLVLAFYLKEGNKEKIQKLVPCIKKASYICLENLSKTQSSPSPEMCMEMLSVLLKSRPQLGELFPQDLVTHTWTALMACENAVVTTPENLKSVIETSSEKELSDILRSLLNATKTAIRNREKLNRKIVAWQAIAASVMSGSKIGVQKDALEQHLCMPLTSWVFYAEDPIELLAVMEFLLELAHNTMLHLSPEMLDLCFVSIKDVSGYASPSERLNLVMQSERLLRTLLQRHTALVLDRTSAYLECCRRVASSLATLSHVDMTLSPVEKQKCANCTQGLERLINLLKDHKAHFARVAAYLVADLLNLFENHTFRHQEKLHFTNCMHSLLSMCDTYALAFLSRSLTSASQQLLKNFYADYSKYHRFTGKI